MTSSTFPVQVVKLDLSAGSVNTVMVDGTPHVVLRPAIDALGLDYSTQVRKLRQRSWATVGQAPTVAEDGKVREMAVVPVRTFLMLLATVNENRVAEGVRPVLVAFQNETADAIEQYWTGGGAVNPRASVEQLDDLQTRIERRRIELAREQMSVIRLADGIIHDRKFLDTKARHVLAIAMGEQPEVPFEQRPLTVGEYLADKGVSDSVAARMSGEFGKRVKGLYVGRHGTPPPVVDRIIRNRNTRVASYTEAERGLMDEVWSTYGRAAAGGAR